MANKMKQTKNKIIETENHASQTKPFTSLKLIKPDEDISDGVSTYTVRDKTATSLRGDKEEIIEKSFELLRNRKDVYDDSGYDNDDIKAVVEEALTLADAEHKKEVEELLIDIEDRINLCLKDTNKKKEKGMPPEMDWRAEALAYKTSLECIKRTREKYKIPNTKSDDAVKERK